MPLNLQHKGVEPWKLQGMIRDNIRSQSAEGLRWSEYLPCTENDTCQAVCVDIDTFGLIVPTRGADVGNTRCLGHAHLVARVCWSSRP